MPLKKTLNPRRGARCRSLTAKEQRVIRMLLREEASKQSISRVFRCHRDQIRALEDREVRARTKNSKKVLVRRQKIENLSQEIFDFAGQNCGMKNHLRFVYNSNKTIAKALEECGIETSPQTVLRDLHALGIRRGSKAFSRRKRGQKQPPAYC